MRAHLDSGGGVWFLTLTQAHQAHEDLGWLMRSNQVAWHCVRSGGKWSRFKARHGIVGTIKVVEATFGDENGWHPHLHVVVLTEGQALNDPVERARARAWLFKQWTNGLSKNGRRASERYGVDLRVVTDRDDVAEALGRYVAKVKEGWSIGEEAARGDLKRGDGRSRWHPFELLARAVEDGDAWAADRWDEWDEATTGRAAISWSPGLKDRLGVEEVDDETAATADPEDEVRVVIGVAASSWEQLLRRRAAGDFINDVVAHGRRWWSSSGPPPGSADFATVFDRWGVTGTVKPAPGWGERQTGPMVGFVLRDEGRKGRKDQMVAAMGGAPA